MKVLFAGGGTGGHLMPALAIADAMVALNPAVEPFFVGAERGIEATVLPQRKWRYALLPFEPIYRSQWWKNVMLPLAMWRSFRGVRAILQSEQPVLAIGTGGYASGPALYAAMKRGIPTVLQEQNAFPGIATRRLARHARQIHLGFPEARGYLKPGPQTEVFDSGNPIQAPGRDARREARVAKTGLGFDEDGPLVLVIGGSQGALGINRAVAEALASGSWPKGVQLLWQTGAQTFSDYSRYATRASRLAPGALRLAPFLDPIAPAYQAADLVVARAGAMTLAELAAWGLPSILIPLPTAAANHQLTNARALADAGAAVLAEQGTLSGAGLAALVTKLLSRPAALADLSRNILLRARPQAASDIAQAVLRLL